MKKLANNGNIKLALVILITILLSWWVGIYALSTGAGWTWITVSLWITMIGWPFAGLLLGMVLLRGPVRATARNLQFVSVLLWLTIGICLAYVNCKM